MGRPRLHRTAADRAAALKNIRKKTDRRKTTIVAAVTTLDAAEEKKWAPIVKALAKQHGSVKAAVLAGLKRLHDEE